MSAKKRNQNSLAIYANEVSVGTNKKPKKDGRMRTVITRRGKNFRVKFPSRKLGRMVHCESLVEKDAVLHIEYDPDICFYQEQPAEILYYQEDGAVKKYYPDFLIRRQDGSQLFIEVKKEKELAKPDLIKKLAAIAVSMERQGHEFKIWTERLINKEPRSSNIKRIHAAVRVKNITVEATPKLNYARGAAVKFVELLETLGDESKVFMHYMAGNIHIDLDEVIVDETLVKIK